MLRLRSLLAGLALVAAAALSAPAMAQQAPSGEPIKIGFGMGLTGGLASSGKAALLAMKIWEEEINAKGGLLGRPVKLIYYDDQSNPATVPGISPSCSTSIRSISSPAITAPTCWRRRCRS